jgi:hypothetical protein
MAAEWGRRTDEDGARGAGRTTDSANLIGTHGRSRFTRGTTRRGRLPPYSFNIVV